jgi:hypothetical protein
LPRLPRPAATEWLCLFAGLLLIIHYAWLMDDAFIYFRYVDNLLFLGYGLVFNAGEYVEGYSSPLWALVLIVLRWTGMNFWLIVRLVAVLSFVAFWASLVTVNRRMSPTRGPIFNLPLVLLTATYAVNTYFTSGLETPLVQVSAALYALYLVKRDSRVLAVLVGLTPLVRHELALPFLVVWALTWWWRRRFPWTLTLAAVAWVGSWMVFRIYYYADLFPNTFYLKNLVEPSQGFYYLHDTLGTYGFYVLAPLLIGAYVLARRRARFGSDDDDHATTLHGRERAGMLVMATLVAAYVVKIGGDPRHFRYLAFPYILWIAASAGLLEHLWATVSWRAVHRWSVAGGVVALGLVTATLYPPQLAAHPFFGRNHHEGVHGINDANWHRYNRQLRHDPWGSGASIEQKDTYARYERRRKTRAGFDFIPYGEVTNGWWCVELYRNMDQRVVHGYGLTDPILARADVPPDRPGHKEGLKPMSVDLVRLISRTRGRPSADMYDQAIAENRAPLWVIDNIDKIRIIARKQFNTHDFWENLKLAFTPVGRIEPVTRSTHAR